MMHEDVHSYNEDASSCRKTPTVVISFKLSDHCVNENSPSGRQICVEGCGFMNRSFAGILFTLNFDHNSDHNFAENSIQGTVIIALSHYPPCLRI